MKLQALLVIVLNSRALKFCFALLAATALVQLVKPEAVSAHYHYTWTGINWNVQSKGGVCPDSSGGQQTGWAAGANGTATFSVPQGTQWISGRSEHLEVHLCQNSGYDSLVFAHFNIYNKHPNISGLGPGDFYLGGCGTFYCVNRNETYGINTGFSLYTGNLGQGFHELCFNWQGWGWYAPGFWASTQSGTQCYHVTVTAPPPPPDYNNNADLNSNPYPSGVDPGQTLNLTARINNSGNAAAPTTYLRVQVVSDNTGGITNQTANQSSPASSSRGYDAANCTNHGAPNRNPCFWWQYGSIASGQLINNVPFSFTIPLTAPSGSQVCLRAFAHRKSSSSVEDIGNTYCIQVGTQRTPFVTTELGSIHAGTTWGDSPCLVSPNSDVSPGDIRGQVNSTLNSGSKGDYTVSAGGQILSFGSAGTPTGSASDDLTFSNTSSGQYGQICRPDLARRYLVEDPQPSLGVAPGGTINVAALPSGTHTHQGNITISGGAVAASQRSTLVVDGNVYITGNITSAAGPFSVSTVPSLGIIATGNININEGVTNLYGIYVAGSQLSPANTGIINTCQNDLSIATFNPQITVINACNNGLTVNGALIANDIFFRRKAGDAVTGNTPAERIRLVPQLFLRPPPGISGVTTQLRFSGERPPVY